MKFNWSWRVNIIGLILIGVFLRLSYWQYERHEWKLAYIEQMRERLKLPPEDIVSLLNPAQSATPEELTYRRVKVSGTYDFSQEVVLRNRKYKHAMGVHALTPLKIANTDQHVLVNRGFIPLSKATLEQRRAYHKPLTVQFTGLIKENSKKNWMGPADPDVSAKLPRVDAWLRVDLEGLQKQLPYPLLPFYLEIMEIDDIKVIEQTIVDSSQSGRDEIMMMTPREGMMQLDADDVGKGNYPVPVFDTVIPAGRHFGYIFEWAFLALLTAAICLVVQLNKGTLKRSNIPLTK
jgi:surfeit locus 1 family protein